MKRPRFTEWLFGVVIIMMLQIGTAIVCLPFYLHDTRSSQSQWRALTQAVVVLVGIALLPVIVFRWCRFFVRVASRKLLKQSHEEGSNARS
jgi:hypothetical protein